MNHDERLLAEDAESRRRALGTSSFIVEAPAGAGKTELLAQRYLRLLAEVESPEEIVALTFTNKAAAEMRHRILDNLAAAAAGDIPGAEHKRVSFDLAREALATSARRGWNLIDHPGRLRVTTIDALCASIARQMPVLSRFGGEPRLADDAGRHYEEAARRALAWLEEEGDHARAVEGALAHVDNDALRLSQLLAAMLARRDQWLRHALDHGTSEAAEGALRALVLGDLRHAGAAFGEALQQRIMPVARYAAGNVGDDHPLAVLRVWTRPLRSEPEELPLWRGLAALLLTNDDAPRKQLNVKIGFPAKESDGQKKLLTELIADLPATAFEALTQVRRLPEPGYTAEEWQTIEALAGLLRLAAVELWAVFNETGEADFVEVALRARQALGSEAQPTDLALALDYRIRHLLVDEFQDTSPTQVELLVRLTAGWTPDDGRSLFLVGDPMQSIYRFRKADVGLFLDVAGSGLGMLPVERLQLYRNNRSQAPVVAWVNKTFAQVFPAGDDIASGAIRYRPSAATPEDGGDAGVTGHPLVVEADGDAQLVEAREILAIIDAERAAAPMRTIAVLVRARDHLSTLVGEIRRRRPELRFQAVEMERLADRQPVQDLLALTRALLHRGDRVSWLAILRAPWCGLTLADLHALAAGDHISTIWHLSNDTERVALLSPDGQARLSCLTAVVGEALRHQGRAPIRRWVEGVWLLLGGPACLSSATDLADARAFFDLLDEMAAGGRLALDRLDKEVGELFAAPDPQADGSLQFMTLHKAKGLEFDTVILPGLNRKPGGGDTPLMRWEEVLVAGDEHLVVAPMKKRRRDGENLPTPYDYLNRLERRRSQHEAARVLYVGATRAIRRLHWLAAVTPSSKGEIRPQAGSLLELLWPAVSAEFDAVAAVAEAAGDGQAQWDFVPRLLRLAEPVVAELPTTPATSLPASEPGAEEGGEPLDALVGTLVHAYLEMIAGDGLDAWPPERVATLRAAMEIWLAQQGCGDRDAALGAERTQAALATTLGSDDGRWVLQVRDEAAAELAIVKVSDGGTPTHVVDRTFVEDGVRWIIDYKTARPDGNLTAHAERYRPQLERYADLFGDQGLVVRTAIFYAALGRLVELDLNRTD
ncbi:MAG TPA: UvrD-helicase domain-containing protein [Rhodocyclaceae bacterium]|nr:UvrD-helicase domain-containing protein [Rhodocyclaceae bacterium]